ncbi:MAG TPA: ribosomal-processing cysteine protease Prp [Peptococcaceae bacterium]|nr:MAG: Uncharacterized protein XD50_0522 [Clostridia bacterium 41_269]HBT20419.1 ribosomal-processing cysteine protease Prp [Peptococcaceae bacterium]
MIKVEFFVDAGDNIRGFSIKGHAEYAEYGRDIVCAAVSAVSQTAVIGLQKLLGKKPEVFQEKGKLVCMLPKDLDGEERKIGEVVFKTMYYGLEAIKNEYEGYLSLIWRRCES